MYFNGGLTQDKNRRFWYVRFYEGFKVSKQYRFDKFQIIRYLADPQHWETQIESVSDHSRLGPEHDAKVLAEEEEREKRFHDNFMSDHQKGWSDKKIKKADKKYKKWSIKNRIKNEEHYEAYKATPFGKLDITLHEWNNTLQDNHLILAKSYTDDEFDDLLSDKKITWQEDVARFKETVLPASSERGRPYETINVEEVERYKNEGE